MMSLCRKYDLIIQEKEHMVQSDFVTNSGYL